MESRLEEEMEQKKATGGKPQPSTEDDQAQLNDILRTITPIDPLGCVDIGVDGVLRSLTADRKVLYAVGLPTRLVKALLDRSPWSKDREDKFRGVDGIGLSREQMYDPVDKSVLPPPLPEQQIAEARGHLERLGRGEGLQRVDAEDEERKTCPLRVLSNYNLGAEPGRGD